MQSDRQAAYDRGSAIFSPDGRLYQVEYAHEAVSQGGPTVGVRTADSVVFAAHNARQSPLLDPESIEKLHDVDGRIGVATAGHVADGRRLVEYSRQYAHRERLRYGEPPGVEPVTKALADYVQESTQVGGTRPFGVALLVGAVSPEPRLYQLDPSGTPSEWSATAVGSGSDVILDALEAEYEDGLDTRGGLALALRALATEREELSPATVDVGVAGTDGFETLDRDRRETLLSETDLQRGS